MTTEEKLNNFYQHSIEIAHQEAENLITEHEAALEKLFEEHKVIRDRQAAAELADEKENLKREKNKLLSAEQLQIKRALSLKDQELRQKLFSEVAERIEAFRKTPEYITYLCRKIKEAAAYAKDEEIEYYLDPEDAALSAAVSETAGVPVKLEEKSFQGGLRAILPGKHILIDYSFAAALQEERDAFIFEGGEYHE